MTFNTEKLAEIAKPRSEEAKAKAQFRRDNREWIRMSQDIALSLHYYLRKSGMSQKDLAGKMMVSAAYVGKLLKGTENLTLETICKLQNAIGEELLSLAHPYIFKQVLKLSSYKHEFVNDVTSDKYTQTQVITGAFEMGKYELTA